MGETLYILGAVAWILGLVLAFGNITGIFPTFPYAGFIVTVIGTLLHWAGRSELKQEYAQEQAKAVSEAVKVLKIKRALPKLLGVGCPQCGTSKNVQILKATGPTGEEGAKREYRAKCHGCGKEFSGSLKDEARLDF